MSGKIQFETTTYRQFCRRLRRLCPGVTVERLYHEWCVELGRSGDGPPIDYERIARKIRRGPLKRMVRDTS